jgi:6-methylsalicylate decarboxylase
MTSDSQRIDVLHHFLPPEFIADLERRSIAWTGGPPVPEWNVSIATPTTDRTEERP